ncbi:hypothetical protein MKY48_20300 [Paenibacillus sp. FSL W8-0187]|uniref:hypothetical protein n=1 Tax=unclassified Paenibacillus TaxID=185978 RepID=UPI0030DA2810
MESSKEEYERSRGICGNSSFKNSIAGKVITLFRKRPSEGPDFKKSFNDVVNLFICPELITIKSRAPALYLLYNRKNRKKIPNSCFDDSFIVFQNVMLTHEQHQSGGQGNGKSKGSKETH